ncbi:hypothetical protein NQ314_012287 [Rhamnusium bicolor]|uniref:WD repeat-containing protein 74 n=1 Tax=Rhamnusium bicolor TaxID=1586634 RepID=A0AAV8XDH7_9CUCU|nr:hypothetical protein NQ314_012287 [Rhamnusium bicolor]
MDVTTYNFFVGTARGTLLYTSDKPNDIKSVKTEEASEITALTFGRSDDEILVGYDNGYVKIFNIIEKKYTKTFAELEGDGGVVGIGCVNKAFIIGRHDGIINTWDGKKNDYFDINLEQKATLDCLVHNKTRQNIVGTGGEYNDFKLWDVETHQCVFKAKSLGHDQLNLPIPTSVRGITFFPENEHLSGCATKEGHVLLYDDRAQRRPVVKFLQEDASYTTISCAYRERQCLVGTTRGYMQLLDMKAGKCLRTFMSFTGSVTGIACDPSEPYVASISLDRHLRIHNLETKELLHKIYMKQNLTHILMKPVVKNEPKEEENEKEIKDEEYEEIFNNMETVSETATSDKKLKKHKRKTEDTIEKRKKIKKKKSKKAVE